MFTLTCDLLSDFSLFDKSLGRHTLWLQIIMSLIEAVNQCKCLLLLIINISFFGNLNVLLLKKWLVCVTLLTTFIKFSWKKNQIKNFLCEFLWKNIQRKNFQTSFHGKKNRIFFWTRISRKKWKKNFQAVFHEKK